MLTLCLWIFACASTASEPVFDVHTHYKWDQAEITTPEQALQFLDEAGVARAVVIGTPADMALELKKLAPDRVIAFYGPYLLGGEKLSWQFREALVDEVRAGLESGEYQGIGELHLIGGMAIRWQNSRVFSKLLALAREHDVPVMLHTEYASPQPTISICQGNPDNRILLAHAGAVLEPAQVREILEHCENVWMDLAARDPWRYVQNPITDDSGRLLTQWKSLIMRHPDRFMVGSDTVWPVDRGSTWDEPDSGWQQLSRYIAFHRQWLLFLPDREAEMIRWRNAELFFR